MSLTLLIILATAVTSIIAFRNYDLKYRLIFSPTIIEDRNEWYRFLTCGFIHADFMHLLVNMYVLYNFGEAVEQVFKMQLSLGGMRFLLMYLLTIVLANVRTFYKERHNAAYFSLGASGGVSGIVFSFLLMYPTATIGFIFIPLPIPAYIIGPAYLIYSHYMSRRGIGNVNHDAHLWGAIIGLLFTAISLPETVMRYIPGL